MVYAGAVRIRVGRFVGGRDLGVAGRDLGGRGSRLGGSRVADFRTATRNPGRIISARRLRPDVTVTGAARASQLDKAGIGVVISAPIYILLWL